MRRLPLAILLLQLVLSLSSLLEGQPTFNRNASVHDPSVIKVGDRYYVFGSHGASAWSEDLMSWTQVAQTVSAGNPTHFRTFNSELSEMIEWTQSSTLWAADVYQMDDGKFYYYYNVWNNPNNLYRSYMGLAIADDIEGPYIDQGELLRGGDSGFNANIHPNTIDPTLYRDTDDRLWMVYGSYSGGIFVLEIDPVTGFQKPDQSWGTKLLGGAHQLIEGPFIDYNSDTGFYYLFLSYGGLAAADGYNMRVFRSANPTGPYVDPAGNDMTQVTGPYASYGLKLAGNWQFTPVEGEPATSATGYLSPGHNSVIQDPDTGKWFNIFHTRFVGRGEAHEVRVHQMFFNEDGWPVMAPHRFAGETLQAMTSEDVAGSYKVINHGKDITGDLKTSSVIGLQSNGGLAGADGSWSLSDGYNVRITMDGVEYRGVVCPQWDNENRLWLNGFTAVSTSGVSIWGSEVAIRDRTGELEPPSIVPIDDLILGADKTLSFELVNLNPDPELALQYNVLEGPEGLVVNFTNGAVTWEPFASQRGKVYTIRIQVYDLLQPELSDEVAFSVYAAGGFEFEEEAIEFTSAAQDGLLDSAGSPTGFSSRLTGTGASINGNDANMTVDLENGVLYLDSTQSDFNGQAGMGTASAVGLPLSELGFTGEQDFTVIAEFGPFDDNWETIDQVGIFVGTSSSNMTRAAIISPNSPEGLAVHTQSGNDTGATFDASAYNVSDGLTVAISREAGEWTYLVDGTVVVPATPNASFLDSESDLTVGIFAINPLNATSKTVEVISFHASVLSDQPRQSRIQKWRTEHFEDPDSEAAADAADPDGDGRANLLEYVFGTDPGKVEKLSTSSVDVVDGKLVWTFERVDDPSLIYEVRLKEDPSSQSGSLIWRSLAGSNLSGAARVEADAEDAVFMQLSVEATE